jgi:hypothetical protein
MGCWICSALVSVKVSQRSSRSEVSLSTSDLLAAPATVTENDTLARIGTSCFQQLLENNVKKLSPQKWERIVTAFVQLFKTTTAYQLFDETLRSDRELAPGDPSADEGLSQSFEMKNFNRADTLVIYHRFLEFSCSCSSDTHGPRGSNEQYPSNTDTCGSTTHIQADHC